MKDRLWPRRLRRDRPAVGGRARSRRLALGLALGPLLLLIAGCGGCTDSATSQGHPNRPREGQRWQTERLEFALSNLGRLEEFETGDTFQELFRRLNATDPTPEQAPADPLRMSVPEPEMLRQVVDQLNQFARAQDARPDWKVDPLVTSLPPELAGLTVVKTLDKAQFTPYDGLALLEAVWLHSVSDWARGDELDERSRAARLFDWTVRNVQLESGRDRPAAAGTGAGGSAPQFPWETLLLGRGTALERAWVFILLARQQGIDAALVALPDADDPAGKPPRPWTVAVLSEGELYLFDPALGLPIPGPDGIKRNDGRLAIRPATLKQLADDDRLLRQLDLDAGHPYPAKAADLKQVVVLLEGSPDYLSLRMELIEARLSGQQKIVLTAAPSAQAERWKSLAHVGQVRLWTYPYETLYHRTHLKPAAVRQQLAAFLPLYAAPAAPLYKARVLYLKGQFTGERSATEFFQAARPSNEDLAEIQKGLAAEYLKKLPPQVEQMPPAQKAAAIERLKAFAEQAAGYQVTLLLHGKLDASYWLGLMLFQQASFDAAIDYFARRTLDTAPDGPWTAGAVYNLGRTLEAAGQTARAIDVYQSEKAGPGRYGCVLRARWLSAMP